MLSTSSICARHDYGGLLSSPGFSHGFNLWCRPRSITHLSLTTHALLASLPSVCHISHLHHHAPYLRVCVCARARFSSSAPKRFCSCCIRLISNQTKNIRHLSPISILPLSRKRRQWKLKGTSGFLRVERVTASGPCFWMSADHRSMNHYRVSPKSWYVTFPRLQPLLHGAEIITWKKSWLACFLSFVLSFSCKISFLEHNKGFYNSMVCAKHVIICLHCHSAWYIMDAFVSCSLQS